MIMSQLNSTKKGLLTLLGALFASIASSFCCLGPLIYLAFGVSAAGFTNVPMLSWLQFPMMALAIGLIIRGFWRLYLSPYPICENIINRRTLVWLYWISVPLSLVMISYPFVLPWLLEWSE
ncbi:TPA: hypothetical protein U2I61_003739 [Providencia rettgeri]|nr:hypothetical protein [Providencia rettgeri]